MTEAARLAMNEYQREYYAKNKDKMREYRRKYYDKNKEQIREYNRKRYDKNKEQIREYNREYYAKNKDKLCERQRKRYAKNKDKKSKQAELGDVFVCGEHMMNLGAFMTMERYEIGTVDEGYSCYIHVPGLSLKIGTDLGYIEETLKKLKEEIGYGKQ